MISTNAETSLMSGLFSSIALRGMVAGIAGALPWAPLLGWARLRWPAGILVGQVAGITALYLFFFMWPPELQSGRLAAWRTAGLFITVFWKYLMPVSAVAGAVATTWARRSVRPPRWQRIAEAGETIIENDTVPETSATADESSAATDENQS